MAAEQPTSLRPRPDHVLPMQGRMNVWYNTALGDTSKPLNRMPDRSYVSARGTVTHVTSIAIVVEDMVGETALCMLTADVRRRFSSSLAVGNLVLARGLVRQQPDGQRVIDTQAVHKLDPAAVWS